jgi:L-2-hydroxyglutarate oxidase LhgO
MAGEVRGGASSPANLAPNADALQRLLPEVFENDLVPGGSGVRAQALKPDGTLVDDFQFVPSGNVLHVLNVPSPAATASLTIAKAIVDTAATDLGVLG